MIDLRAALKETLAAAYRHSWFCTSGRRSVYCGMCTAAVSSATVTRCRPSVYRNPVDGWTTHLHHLAVARVERRRQRDYEA